MSHVIKSEMTANVWKVLVEVGQQVSVGDELCVLESMKMEIPVQADAAAEVREVHVAEGESIQEGAPLVTLDP